MPVEPKIVLEGKNWEVTLPLGLSAPVPTAGGGVIEEQTRAGREAVSVYAGTALERWDVPILLDSAAPNHFRNGTINRGGRADQRPRYRRLMAIARGDDLQPPPHFKVRGPVLFAGQIFQLDGLPDWLTDPEPIIEEDGSIVRLALTLHLVEWAPPQVPRWKRAGQPASFTFPKTYTTKKDDTLTKIAMHLYESPAWAPKIGALNGIKDVTKKLDAGKTLKLPEGGKTVSVGNKVAL